MLLLSFHLRLTPTISFPPQGFHSNNISVSSTKHVSMFHLPHSFSQQRSGFKDKADSVGFVVHEVAVGQVFLPVLRFFHITHSTNASFAHSFDATYTILSRSGVSIPRPARMYMRSVVTFVNYAYTVKSGNNSGGKLPFTVSFQHAARKPTHNNGCSTSLIKKKSWLC
jgi:hypothetical protein